MAGIFCKLLYANEMFSKSGKPANKLSGKSSDMQWLIEMPFLGVAAHSHDVNFEQMI